jgi:phosphoribosylformimino-5-aminoimidazole carboxamide ribotide isomerase
MSMQIIPAIDLLDGGCVRLKHGDFKQRTNYAVDAVELARAYAREGAGWLHVVDLAASRDGADADIQPLLRLLKKSPQSVQTGGGVRDETDLHARLDQGADRVVVGSICVAQPEMFAAWLEKFGPDKLVAALDVQIDDSGIPWPRTHGWTQGSVQNLWEILDFHADKGLKHLLCTDISRDGAMTGPNLALYREIISKYPRLSVQASGGVSSLSDLENLAQTGVDSAITGKALLDGCFTVAEAVSILL